VNRLVYVHVMEQPGPSAHSLGHLEIGCSRYPVTLSKIRLDKIQCVYGNTVACMVVMMMITVWSDRNQHPLITEGRTSQVPKHCTPFLTNARLPNQLATR
jgi:hypothetical protein